MHDKFHSLRGLNLLLLSLLSYFTKFIKHTGQQSKLTVDSLKPETVSHTALFKQWKSLPGDIADVSYSGFKKGVGKFVEVKNKQGLLTAKTTFFAQEGPELQISGKWRNTLRKFDAYWRSSSISSPGIH